jgi:hypothetical protein
MVSKKAIKEFMKNSTFHGLDYVVDQNYDIYKR